MPWRTKNRGRRRSIPLAIAATILALVGTGALAAQDAAPIPAPAAMIAYADLLSAGIGASLGALNLRGGFEKPLAGPWSLSGEAGAYWAGTSGMASYQVDIAGVARWRPLGARGPFAGAGAGIAAAMVAAAPGSGGSASWNTIGLKAVALAEAGWSFGRATSPLRFEPFARLCAALGPEISAGSAPGPRRDTAIRTALSGALGFRLGWQSSDARK